METFWVLWFITWFYMYLQARSQQKAIQTLEQRVIELESQWSRSRLWASSDIDVDD